MSFRLESKDFRQTLYHGNKFLNAIEIEQLCPDRGVYQINIEAVDNLPQTLIVKQQKKGWEEEFRQEVQAYQKLELLQGKVIPYFFGEGIFNELPAIMLSKVEGMTLYAIARNRELIIEEETLKVPLETAFNELSMFGAVYWDQKLDNFLFCNDENCDGGKVMVIDLEQVKFPTEPRPWELQVNRLGARSLMRDFRDIRHPDRDSSPVRTTRARKRR